MTNDRTASRHGLAWVGLSLALALHVADEAWNGFLSFYNPLVRRIREEIPLLPLPTFGFELWLTGLALAVGILLALSAAVFRGRRWTVPASYVLGGFMCLNAFGHFGASMVYGRPMPGVCSSPLLLAAAVWLLVCARGRCGGTPLG
ncbi:MAG: HXXEE domain-containing protein [Acidobacteria bacterium]|nr:HXXEE domain-containing protein [Acidobacteriota bacterium]